MSLSLYDKGVADVLTKLKNVQHIAGKGPLTETEVQQALLDITECLIDFVYNVRNAVDQEQSYEMEQNEYR
jgi:hypothetical protein